MIVKLNEGFSGEGNAVFNLDNIKQHTSNSSDKSKIQTVIYNSLKDLSFQAESETWENFSSRIPELGAIVEAFIEGKEKRSPSVQGYINPNGNVSIVSTHDQILGGPDGQIYLGCRFPADQAYRNQLQELGLKIGQELAKKGAMERYGVDFLAVRHQSEQGEEWNIQAI